MEKLRIAYGKVINGSAEAILDGAVIGQADRVLVQDGCLILERDGRALAGIAPGGWTAYSIVEVP